MLKDLGSVLKIQEGCKNQAHIFQNCEKHANTLVSMCFGLRYINTLGFQEGLSKGILTVKRLAVKAMEQIMPVRLVPLSDGRQLVFYSAGAEVGSDSFLARVDWQCVVQCRQSVVVLDLPAYHIHLASYLFSFLLVFLAFILLVCQACQWHTSLPPSVRSKLLTLALEHS